MKESSCKSPLMATYCQEVHKLVDRFQEIELHHVPQKDNVATDLLVKLVAKWDPPPDGVFVNDLHEPSDCVRADPSQMWPDPDRVFGGSNAPTRPDPDKALGGSIPDASMATSPSGTTVMALDPADCRVPLLAYILEVVLPLERTEA
ncbi:uncharacterized protein LOC105915185 [Setaria italica]|uniref:uncharacterized protein LOC105915185 n=1 Tax=Setaria italica TaxID=4555 RepID=UPI0006486EE2|nr:uncharacterized protein LOC105915185 [Setaria italica]